MAEQPAHTRYVWGSSPHPATQGGGVEPMGFKPTKVALFRKMRSVQTVCM